MFHLIEVLIYTAAVGKAGWWLRSKVSRNA